MTLLHFLKENGLSLNQSQQSRIGEIISQRYRAVYFKPAEKVSIPEIEDGKVNDYPISFLEDNSPTIIRFLTEIQNLNG